MARNRYALDSRRDIEAAFGLHPEAWDNLDTTQDLPERAPAGRRDIAGTVWLGKKVVFDTVLVRFRRIEGEGENLHRARDERRDWVRIRLARTVYGVVVGARDLQSGQYNPGKFRPALDGLGPTDDYEEPYLSGIQTHRTLIVAWDLWRLPVFVLVDDAKNPPITFEEVEYDRAELAEALRVASHIIGPREAP